MLGNRPSWDDYFMMMASVAAMRATCDRLHVGAVIVRDRHIIETGYNGAPPGQPHCDDVGHLLHEINGRPSCQRATHAEQNAINTAARFGHATGGATIYVTHQPCANCAKAIVTAGITRCFWKTGYADDSGVRILLDAGVEARRIETEVGVVIAPTRLFGERPDAT
jgi:dCMP deaminase